MIISPFFFSALILCIPLLLASFQDLTRYTVSLNTWKWTLLAVPSSVLGWITWYSSGKMEYRVFLLLAGFIACFFIAGYLWQTGKPSIGGGDILAICLMLLYVPVLPELGNIIYIFPVCILALIYSLYWNARGKETPFLFPFTISHVSLLLIASFI